MSQSVTTNKHVEYVLKPAFLNWWFTTQKLVADLFLFALWSVSLKCSNNNDIHMLKCMNQTEKHNGAQLWITWFTFFQSYIHSLTHSLIRPSSIPTSVCGSNLQQQKNLFLFAFTVLMNVPGNVRVRRSGLPWLALCSSSLPQPLLQSLGRRTNRFTWPTQ